MRESFRVKYIPTSFSLQGFRLALPRGKDGLATTRTGQTGQTTRMEIK